MPKEPTESELKYFEAYQRCGGFRAAARELRCNKESVRQAVISLRNKGVDVTSHVDQPTGYKTGKITKQFDGEGNVIMEWPRFSPTEECLEQFAQTLATPCKGTVPHIKLPKRVANGHCLVINLADLHTGLRVWAAECGVDWDTDIAIDHYKQSFAELIDRAGPTERIIVQNLGDLTHADDNRNATPKSGHSLDVDGRHQRTVRKTAEFVRWCLQYAATKCRDVHFRSVRGNHDINSSYVICLALEYAFEKVKQVTVHTTPEKHQYWSWGQTGFMLTHGDTGKPQRLLQTFTVTDVWKSTTWHEIHQGHTHGNKVTTSPSCHHEVFGTAAPGDTHSVEEAYGQYRQEMHSKLYHKEVGVIHRDIALIVPPRKR